MAAAETPANIFTPPATGLNGCPHGPHRECSDCLTADYNRRFEGDSAIRVLSDLLRHPLKSAVIVCPTCGAKRCPKATNHARRCTNSNAPGQPGSRYWPTNPPA